MEDLAGPIDATFHDRARLRAFLILSGPIGSRPVRGNVKARRSHLTEPFETKFGEVGPVEYD
jgi:hypothetical protein